MKQLLYCLVLAWVLFMLGCQKSSEPQERLTVLSISPNHGPAGTIDTIRGWGFSDSIGLNAVFFNGKAATVIRAYDSTLIVRVPYQAGTGKVSVTVGNVTVMGPVFTYEPSAIVSTFAGSEDAGFLDGNVLNARFSYPTSIVKDITGNFYVTDNYNRSVRKITPAGVVSTFAKFDNLMSSPKGIAIDGAGNLYVADVVMDAVYKVTPSGVVSYYATLNVGLNSPLDVAVSADGTVYVADYNNRRVAKVTSQGPATTYAGNGVITNFIRPIGIKFDTAGNLYVIEEDKIKKITPSGSISTVIGSDTGAYGDGPALSTRFYNLQNIAFDAAGTMYIAERTRIRKLTADGIVKTIAGNGQFGFADGVGLDAQFNSAAALVFDANGHIFVADNENNRIRKIIFE